MRCPYILSVSVHHWQASCWNSIYSHRSLNCHQPILLTLILRCAFVQSTRLTNINVHKFQSYTNSLSRRMAGLATSQSFVGQTDREIGTLYTSEQWWRDQYFEIEDHGYELRPRYHPDWKPSWRRSGKDFFSMEDGQPTIVSAIFLVLSVLIDYISYALPWMQRGDAMESTSCSRRSFPRRGHTS